jgi:hypothetical protein
MIYSFLSLKYPKDAIPIPWPSVEALFLAVAETDGDK